MTVAEAIKAALSSDNLEEGATNILISLGIDTKAWPPYFENELLWDNWKKMDRVTRLVTLTKWIQAEVADLSYLIVNEEYDRLRAMATTSKLIHHCPTCAAKLIEVDEYHWLCPTGCYAKPIGLEEMNQRIKLSTGDY